VPFTYVVREPIKSVTTFQRGKLQPLFLGSSKLALASQTRLPRRKTMNRNIYINDQVGERNNPPPHFLKEIMFFCIHNP